MPLQTTGAISLSQIQTGLGGANPISMTEYYKGGAYTASAGIGNASIPTSGALDMTDFYGADNTLPPTGSRNIGGGPGTTSTSNFLGGNTAYSTAVTSSYYSMPGSPTLYVVTNGTDENEIIQIAFGGMASGDLDNLQTSLNGDDFNNFYVGKNNSVQLYQVVNKRNGWYRLNGTNVGDVIYFNPVNPINGAAGWLQGFDFSMEFSP